MNNSYVNLMLTQLREFYREPQIIFWSFIFPLLLVWILGITFSGETVDQRVIGIVMPGTEETKNSSIQNWVNSVTETEEYIFSKVRNSSHMKHDYLIKTRYKLKRYKNREDVILGLKRGEIEIFIDMDRVSGDRVYYFDPQNNDALLTYFLLEDRTRSVSQPLEKNISVLEKPGLRYIDFLIPGLIAMAIMETSLIAIGWSLIEKRISKVVRQLSATPMRKHELLSSHIIMCMVFNFVEIIILFIFAKVYFDVELQGGYSAFALLVFCGNICFAGIAVLTASRGMKAQTANGVLEVTILLLIIFSGIFFSYKNFPGWLVAIVERLPLTILADSMRMVFIEGAGTGQVLIQGITLMLIGIISFVVGMKIFRWY